MVYFLTGEGATKPPYNLFVVDHETGYVRITGIVDREKHPKFSVSLSSHISLRYGLGRRHLGRFGSAQFQCFSF